MSIKAEVEELAKPNFLTNWFVRCPCLCIVIGFVIMFLFAIIAVSADLMSPSEQSDRGYLVWGDPYVNNFDKTYLAKEYLRTQTGSDDAKATLQSQTMPGWLAMIIYTVPNDSVDDIWTKTGLISVRNFENSIKADPNFKKSCVADPAPDGAVDIVFCNEAAALNSPLNLFPNANNLENMTEA